VANFRHFEKNIFKKENSARNSFFYSKYSKFLTKIVMIAYNMQGCLRFYTFMFLVSPDLAK